jgi:hypothetical protein
VPAVQAPLPSYTVSVLESLHVEAGGAWQTFGAVMQPVALHLPCRHGSLGTQETPKLRSLQGSLSYWPQLAKLRPAHWLPVHSSAQVAEQAPFEQVVPAAQGKMGPHSRQPS